jgi:hypothetical protein
MPLQPKGIPSRLPSETEFSTLEEVLATKIVSPSHNQLFAVLIWQRNPSALLLTVSCLTTHDSRPNDQRRFV